jgi:hypothetical protein
MQSKHIASILKEFWAFKGKFTQQLKDYQAEDDVNEARMEEVMIKN